MRKDDTLELLRPEGAWSLVRNCVTGREGMVPSSFLAKAYSLEAEPWFFGPITRAKVQGLYGGRGHPKLYTLHIDNSPLFFVVDVRTG